MNRLVVAFLAIGLVSSSYGKSPKLKHPMQVLAEDQHGSFYAQGVPDGFEAKELRVTQRPKKTKAFRAYLAKLETEAVQKWRAYVDENSGEDGEFSESTPEELAEMKRDPKGHLDVEFLVQIDQVYAIYKDRQLVGYVYDMGDHVQAAIYQDGAGTVLYVDPDHNVIALEEWSA